MDTLQCIIALQARGVKIRSLHETEGWTQFLELEPGDPMAFVGHQMVSMAAWVADQERFVNWPEQIRRLRNAHQVCHEKTKQGD